MKISIPVESGNKALKEGFLAKTVQSFVERMKPEACYFGPENGKRTAWFIIEMANVADMPSVTEPFFSTLNASVEMIPIMNLDDLTAGLAKATKH